MPGVDNRTGAPRFTLPRPNFTTAAALIEGGQQYVDFRPYRQNKFKDR